MPSRLRKLIGNRAFYAMVIAVVVPIIVQNAITNFVNLLDNLMVGSIGTDEMSGVAIANQLIFVFNLTIFGVISAAGIFTAQYHGAENQDGVRATHRFKVYTCAAAFVIFTILVYGAGEKLVSLYLTDTSDPVRVARTLEFGMVYLRIILWGVLPFSLAQCYASTLRETGETRIPMFASISAVLVNLLFNYLLIFGKFGFPALGVSGAAYATVLSRFVELGILLIYTHTHARRHVFADGLYRTLSIPVKVLRDVSITGLPLLINEILWAWGVAALTQIYTFRGLDVVAATNISSTVYNVFSVAFLSMGSASAIIVGQSLGAGETATARDHAGKLTAFAIMISLVIGVILFSFSGLIPLMYNTSGAVHHLATSFIRVSCCIMPFTAAANNSYFIIRSGGSTVITFLFDSVFSWVVCIPTAYLLTKHTGLGIVQVYLLVQSLEIIKATVGTTLVRKGVWIKNLVAGQ